MKKLSLDIIRSDLTKKMLETVYEKADNLEKAVLLLREEIKARKFHPLKEERITQLLAKFGYAKEGDAKPSISEAKLIKVHLAFQIELFIAWAKYDRELALDFLEEWIKDSDRILAFPKKSLKKVFSFLDNPPRFLSGIKSEDAVLQILEPLLNPTTVAQKKSPLCGVDVYLRFLVQHLPEKYIEFAYNLLHEGKSNIPFNISMRKCHPQEKKHLLLTMMEAIRHTENFFGYYPNRLFPEFFGITFFKEIVQWITRSGGIIHYKSTRLINRNFEEAPDIIASKIEGQKKIFSQGYADIEANPIEVIKRAIFRGDFCMAAFTSHIANYLSSHDVEGQRRILVNEQATEVIDPETCFGFQEAHTVQVVNIEEEKRPKNVPPGVVISLQKGHAYKVGKYYIYAMCSLEFFDKEWKVVFYQGKKILYEVSASKVEGLVSIVKDKTPSEEAIPYCQDPNRFTLAEESKIVSCILDYHKNHYLSEEDKLGLTTAVDGVKVSLETWGGKFICHFTKPVFLKYLKSLLVVDGESAYLALKEEFSSEQARCK